MSQNTPSLRGSSRRIAPAANTRASSKVRSRLSQPFIESRRLYIDSPEFETALAIAPITLLRTFSREQHQAIAANGRFSHRRTGSPAANRVNVRDRPFYHRVVQRDRDEAEHCSITRRPMTSRSASGEGESLKAAMIQFVRSA